MPEIVDGGENMAIGCRQGVDCDRILTSGVKNMSCYFFHMEGHTSAPERVEMQLDDLAEVRAHTAVAIGDMLSRAGTGFWNGPGWHVDVTDETGQVVCSLSIQGRATDAPRTAKPTTLMRAKRAMTVVASNDDARGGSTVRRASAAAG
jgi:hypothetical protein